MQLILSYFDSLLVNTKTRYIFKISNIFLEIALSNLCMLDLEKQSLNAYPNFMNKTSLAEIFLT